MKQIEKVNRADMRQNNTRLIFETICRNDGITRTQLVAKTGMSEMTVGRLVDLLLKNNLLTEKLNENNKDVGRPALRLYLNKDFVNVGVSLDTGEVFIGLVDPYGKILKSRKHSFQTESMEPEETLGTVAELIEKFIAEHDLKDIQNIGMVIPGLIDQESGCVRYSTQFKWSNVPVVEILKKNPNIPNVIIENDIKARAQGETRLGVGKDSKCTILLNIGSGVGAGIVIGGEIYRGKENYAGEIGHTMLSMNNRICACGRKGCIETTISKGAFMHEAQTIHPDIDIAGIEAAYHEKKLWASTLLGITADNILMVINLLANTFAPDVIVLCGSLMDQCATLREIVFDLHRKCYSEIFNNYFSLEYSKFGPDGNLIGAMAIAFNHNLTQIITNTAPS